MSLLDENVVSYVFPETLTEDLDLDLLLNDGLQSLLVQRLIVDLPNGCETSNAP